MANLSKKTASELATLSKQFEKRASSEADLDGLLQAALNGDKDSYHIFFDLLEEVEPAARIQLTGASIATVFETLSKICPNVIREAWTDSYAFSNPFDVEYLMMYSNGTFRVSLTEYRSHGAGWGSSYSGPIIFNNPQIVAGVQVEMIKKFEDLFELGIDDDNSIDIPIGDERYAVVEETYNRLKDNLKRVHEIYQDIFGRTPGSLGVGAAYNKAKFFEKLASLNFVSDEGEGEPEAPLEPLTERQMEMMGFVDSDEIADALWESYPEHRSFFKEKGIYTDLHPEYADVHNAVLSSKLNDAMGKSHMDYNLPRALTSQERKAIYENSIINITPAQKMKMYMDHGLPVPSELTRLVPKKKTRR